MIALTLAAFWIVALLAFAFGARALLYLFFGSVAFGTFAVVPPALTGGLTLTPLPIVTLLIILRTLLMPGASARILRAATSLSPQGILAAFWVLAGLVTMFMPRIFAGLVMVIPMRVVDREAVPLYPSTQNFSQFIYLSVSVVSVFVFAELLQDPKLRRTALRAIVAGGTVAVLTGMLDAVSQVVPLDALMDAFRTATYALLVDAEVLGAKRIVGLMPEASSYGGICLTFLSLIYFLRRSFDPSALFRRLATLVGFLLLVFTYLSTSSAAYLGLGVLALLAAAEWGWRYATLPFEAGQHAGLRRDAVLVFVGFVGFVAALLFHPTIFDRVIELLNNTLIEKSASQSFEERSMWTRVAWQAAADTYGLGVGVGGARASNFWAALASNVGYLGAALYAAFMLSCYTRRIRAADWQTFFMLSGCRWALLPGLAVGWVVGTSADFGVVNGLIFGLMLGASRSTLRERARSPYLTMTTAA